MLILVNIHILFNFHLILLIGLFKFICTIFVQLLITLGYYLVFISRLFLNIRIIQV